jgi:primosomal protein N' (replication factor Y)
MIAHVALPLPIDKFFSYAVPELLAPFARPLARVRVPFHNRSVVGYIIAMEDGEDAGLKDVQGLVDCVPLIDGACYDLCKWASLYYAVPIGLALKYALSSAISVEKYCLVRTSDPALAYLDGLTLKKACATTGRLRVLDYLNRSLIDLADPFTGKAMERAAAPGPASGSAPRPALFIAGVEERLDLYTSLIGEELDRGRSVLMLLPDYRASGAFFSRAFARSFPGAVFWYGSSAPGKRKAETYFRARAEGARLILGNKSCVFLPVAVNGLIIIERPEEDEYRNEEAFRFNAVRLALKRAEIEGVRCVVGSAAPPVEIVKWASEGAFDVTEGKPLDMPRVVSSVGGGEREGGALLPEDVVSAIEETLGQGGSVAVHVPRRSYASSLSCAACGRPLACPACGAGALAYQRQTESLACGVCKRTFPYEERCPECGSDLIKFFEVGAEYLEARIKEAFPSAAVSRVTGEADRPRDAGAHATTGGRIVVGTNILSKLYGLDAELLILYGWEDFLRIGGYRARERMFQLLANLRDALRPGKLLFHMRKDAFDPALFLDARRLYADELEKRRAAAFPPFVRFFAVNILRRNKEAGERVIRAIEDLAREAQLDRQMLGPIQVKGQYGWKVILKGDGETLSPLLSSLYRLPGVHIEADPLSV